MELPIKKAAQKTGWRQWLSLPAIVISLVITVVIAGLFIAAVVFLPTEEQRQKAEQHFAEIRQKTPQDDIAPLFIEVAVITAYSRSGGSPEEYKELGDVYVSWLIAAWTGGRKKHQYKEDVLGIMKKYHPDIQTAEQVETLFKERLQGYPTFFSPQGYTQLVLILGFSFFIGLVLLVILHAAAWLWRYTRRDKQHNL